LWHGANAEEEAIYLAALRQGLDSFGYVEGQNVALEMRFPAELYERFFVLAVKPVGKPDAGNRYVRFDERGWETGRWPT
jgi:putative ABC transport system substrate-binding protein